MNIPQGPPPGGRNVPTLGQGEQLTPEELQKMIRAKRANAAMQFMGQMCVNVPKVWDADEGGDYERKMTPTEMFEYAMGLVEQIDLYIEVEPVTNLV